MVGCFMAGNPGETHETLAKTLKLAKDLNPDTAQFFPLMVYPGSEAYEWVKQNNNLITEDYIGWLQKEIDRLKWQGCCEHNLQDRDFEGDTHQAPTYTVEVCKVCGKYMKKHNTTDIKILYKDLNDRVEQEPIPMNTLDNTEVLIKSEDKSTSGGTT